jgi:hypothetical protein
VILLVNFKTNGVTPAEPSKVAAVVAVEDSPLPH